MTSIALRDHAYHPIDRRDIAAHLRGVLTKIEGGTTPQHCAVSL
jgi:hypothetical protein